MFQASVAQDMDIYGSAFAKLVQPSCLEPLWLEPKWLRQEEAGGCKAHVTCTWGREGGGGLQENLQLSI